MADSQPVNTTSGGEILPILFQDEHLVAINKPSGLLVHKSPIDQRETRFAMKILRDQLGQWVYPIHRLDKPTSGVLLFALSSEVARLVCDHWSQQVQKHYLAIVRGWAPQQTIVDHPLQEKLDKIADRQAQADKPAQQAVTDFCCLARAELDHSVDKYPRSRYSLVSAAPHTGRKHQIRRHLKHLSHPIIGDAKYGKSAHNRFFQQHFGADRLLLHADCLQLRHPLTGRALSIQAPLDSNFETILNRLDWLAALAAQRAGYHHETG